MRYTTPDEVTPISTDHAVRKYHGPVASGYDAKRQQSPKWRAENELFRQELQDLDARSTVLDVPIGTGRFMELYDEFDLHPTGVDVSRDMLAEAAKKTSGHAQLQIGDVRELNFDGRSFDAAVMCRLTRWLSPEDRTIALGELQRVAKKRILFTARVANHPHAYSYEAIDKALVGWSIVRNHQIGDDDDYRLIVLEPSE